MLKKSLATLGAILLASALALISVAPAQAAADTRPGNRDKGYGIAAYVYKKLDPAKPASWANSGPQRLLIQDVERTSKSANDWFRSLDPALLPADVCGPGWAIQQDKVEFKGSFSFPETITPPHDNIGWPPIYDAKHQELSSLMKVPDCPAAPPAKASVSITPATCEAPEKLVLGTATNAVWGAVTGTSTGPGSYSVTATAASGSTFADGKSTQTFSGTLAGKLPKKDPACAPAPLVVEPTSTAPTCDVPGQYTLPAVEHVTWIVGGAVVAPGDYTAEPGTSVTVTAVADRGWVIDGGTKDKKTKQWKRSWTLEFPNPDCPTPREVTPTVLYDPTTCEGPGEFTLPEIEGVIWKVDGVVTAPGTYSGDAPSTKVVTAELDQSGGPVEFAPGAQTSWTLEFAEPEDCDLPTQAFFPTSAVLSPQCDGTGILTLGQVGGVSFFEDVNYFIDGVPATSSTVLLQPGQYVVTATTKSPTDALDGPSSWTFTVAIPDDCELPTFGIFPTNAQLSEQCDGPSVLTLGLVGGVSFFADVNYFIDGVPATSPTVRLEPGEYLVTVTTKSPTDSLDGPTQWRITVAAPQVCADLPTLALTGSDAGSALGLAGILAALGAALMLARRIRHGKTAE